MEKLDISAIILTGNEELHIKRCLDRICDIVKKVYVIDCFSTDRTVEIAESYKEVTVLKNKWVNYSTQFNWALDNAPINTKWVMRLDADEYLEDSTKQRLREEMPNLPDEVSAIDLRLKHFFLGKYIKGGTGRKYLTRFFRYGIGRCENKQMDEHIYITKGVRVVWKEACCDDNLNNLSWWTTKHNGYSIREVVDLLDIEYNLIPKQTQGNIGSNASSTRSAKLKYAKLPLFWRSFAYFIYRYFIKGGCLEGKEGFLWCFLQGWWYRTLVDAKIYEIKKICGNDRDKIIAYLNSTYNMNL